MQRYLPILAMAFAVGSPALAQQARQPQRPATPSLAEQAGRAVQGCVGADRTPAKLTECIDRQRASLEQRLAQLTARAQAMLTQPGRREAFDIATTAWAAYRDRQCEFMAMDRAGGPSNAVDRADCLLDFTVARLEEVEEALRPPPTPSAQQRPAQPARPPAR